MGGGFRLKNYGLYYLLSNVQNRSFKGFINLGHPDIGVAVVLRVGDGEGLVGVDGASREG